MHYYLVTRQLLEALRVYMGVARALLFGCLAVAQVFGVIRDIAKWLVWRFRQLCGCLGIATVARQLRVITRVLLRHCYVVARQLLRCCYVVTRVYRYQVIARVFL